MKLSLPAGLAERAGSNLPGFFLALAFFCGGLRLPGAWLAFAFIFLPWIAAGRGNFAPAERPAAPLFFAWLALAAIFSPEPAASWCAFSRYLLPGLLFFYATSSAEGENNWLGAVMVLGGVCAAALLGQRLSGRPVTGLIGLNPNYTAVFAAASFPAALLAAGSETGRKKLLAAGFAFFLAAGVLASGSRGALLAALLSAAAALPLAGRWKLLALLCLAALAAFAVMPASFLDGLFKFSDLRAFERPRLWGAALKIAADAPFFGAGPGLFEQAFETVKFPFFDGISYYGHSTAHAHGEIFNLAAEAGFPAAVFFAAAFAGALYAGAKRYPALTGCALAVFIQGNVDVVLHSGAVALLFWGTLGFLARSGVAGGTPRIKLRIALGALCLAGFFSGLRSGGSPGPYGLARASDVRPGAESSPALALALPRLAMLDRPKDPFAARAAGVAAAAAGDLEHAELYLKSALELEPLFAGARIALAEVYGAGGRKAGGCLELKALARPVMGQSKNAYQRGLLEFDRLELDRAEQDLCGKMRTGATTARTLKAR